MHIQRLFIHPIKSLLPVEVTSARITDAGLEHDRSFILVKDQPPSEAGLSEHLTIKTTSRLCLFRQSVDLDQGTLTVDFTTNREIVESFTLMLDPQWEMPIFTHRCVVEMFGTQASGWDVSDEAAAFFSKHLGQPVRLIYIGQGGQRDIVFPGWIPKTPKAKVNRSWLGTLLGKEEAEEELHAQKIRMHDAAPLLVTTTASEADAKGRVEESLKDEDLLLRFRTNVHIDTSQHSGFKVYEEDQWTKAVIHTAEGQEVDLDFVFKTPRCQSLNVDYDSGALLEPKKQVLKTLTKDRRVNEAFPHAPCFGVYAFAAPSGVILRVGDEFDVRSTEA